VINLSSHYPLQDEITHVADVAWELRRNYRFRGGIDHHPYDFSYVAGELRHNYRLRGGIDHHHNEFS
jgi:hypothetical protein